MILMFDVMKNRYFIVLNAKVVASCVSWKKSLKLWGHWKTLVNPDADILQLWEKGFGIIEEF